MVSKSDLKKPLKSLSKLEKERVLKYKRGEEEEKLSVLGQESERKAKPWVQREVAAWEKKEKAQRELDWSNLTKLRNNRKEYFRKLVEIFLRFAQEEEIPLKYQILVDLTDQGIIIKIAKTNYLGAFTPCGMPFYDRHYCKIMAVKLGNTIGKLEGHLKKSAGGIILPDGEDLSAYGP